MTLDAFSDLVLFLACGWIVWTAFKTNLKTSNTRAGIGLAALLIGFAALLGTIKFSSFSEASALVKGAHQFASLVAGVGAFPILAFSLANPKSPIAQRMVGAWWFTFAVAGFGVALVVLGFKLWGQIVPAVCALWIGYTVLFKPHANRVWLIVGWVSLVASFCATLFIKPDVLVFGVLSKVQLLHYFLALGLALLAMFSGQQNQSYMQKR